MGKDRCESGGSGDTSSASRLPEDGQCVPGEGESVRGGGGDASETTGAQTAPVQPPVRQSAQQPQAVFERGPKPSAPNSVSAGNALFRAPTSQSLPFVYLGVAFRFEPGQRIIMDEGPGRFEDVAEITAITAKGIELRYVRSGKVEVLSAEELTKRILRRNDEYPWKLALLAYRDGQYVYDELKAQPVKVEETDAKKASAAEAEILEMLDPGKRRLRELGEYLADLERARRETEELFRQWVREKGSDLSVSGGFRALYRWARYGEPIAELLSSVPQDELAEWRGRLAKLDDRIAMAGKCMANARQGKPLADGIPEGRLKSDGVLYRMALVEKTGRPLTWREDLEIDSSTFLEAEGRGDLKGAMEAYGSLVARYLAYMPEVLRLPPSMEGARGAPTFTARINRLIRNGLLKTNLVCVAMAADLLAIREDIRRYNHSVAEAYGAQGDGRDAMALGGGGFIDMREFDREVGRLVALEGANPQVTRVLDEAQKRMHRFIAEQRSSEEWASLRSFVTGMVEVVDSAEFWAMVLASRGSAIIGAAAEARLVAAGVRGLRLRAASLFVHGMSFHNIQSMVMLGLNVGDFGGRGVDFTPQGNLKSVAMMWWLGRIQKLYGAKVMPEFARFLENHKTAFWILNTASQKTVEVIGMASFDIGLMTASGGVAALNPEAVRQHIISSAQFVLAMGIGHAGRKGPKESYEAARERFTKTVVELATAPADRVAELNRKATEQYLEVAKEHERYLERQLVNLEKGAKSGERGYEMARKQLQEQLDLVRQKRQRTEGLVSAMRNGRPAQPVERTATAPPHDARPPVRQPAVPVSSGGQSRDEKRTGPPRRRHPRDRISPAEAARRLGEAVQHRLGHPEPASASERTGEVVRAARRPDPGRSRHGWDVRLRRAAARHERPAHPAAPAEHGPGRARNPDEAQARPPPARRHKTCILARGQDPNHPTIELYLEGDVVFEGASHLVARGRNRLTVGSDRALSDFVVANDKVSGRHFTIYQREDGLWIIENHDVVRYGTFIIRNGVRLAVREPAELMRGDVIEVHGCRWKFDWEPAKSERGAEEGRGGKDPAVAGTAPAPTTEGEPPAPPAVEPPRLIPKGSGKAVSLDFTKGGDIIVGRPGETGGHVQTVTEGDVNFVSREHATIRHGVDGTYWIHDGAESKKSSNGTFVRRGVSKPIDASEWIKLEDGDVVILGGVEFVWREPSVSETASAPAGPTRWQAVFVPGREGESIPPFLPPSADGVAVMEGWSIAIRRLPDGRYEIMDRRQLVRKVEEGKHIPLGMNLAMELTLDDITMVPGRWYPVHPGSRLQRGVRTYRIGFGTAFDSALSALPDKSQREIRGRLGRAGSATELREALDGLNALLDLKGSEPTLIEFYRALARELATVDACLRGEAQAVALSHEVREPFLKLLEAQAKELEGQLPAGNRPLVIDVDHALNAGSSAERRYHAVRSAMELMTAIGQSADFNELKMALHNSPLAMAEQAAKNLEKLRWVRTDPGAETKNLRNLIDSVPEELGLRRKLRELYFRMEATDDGLAPGAEPAMDANMRVIFESVMRTAGDRGIARSDGTPYTRAELEEIIYQVLERGLPVEHVPRDHKLRGLVLAHMQEVTRQVHESEWPSDDVNYFSGESLLDHNGDRNLQRCYRFARMWLNYKDGRPLMGRPTQRERDGIVGFAQAAVGFAPKGVGSDYADARRALCDVMDHFAGSPHAERFRAGFLRLSEEARAMVVSAYFGPFWHHPMADYNSAMALARFVGSAGYYREIGVTIVYGGGGRFTPYLSLGEFSRVSPAGIRHVFVFHTHPKFYKNEAGRIMGEEPSTGGEKATMFLSPTETNPDLSTINVLFSHQDVRIGIWAASSLALGGCQASPFYTPHTDGRGGVFRNWVSHPYGAAVMEVEVDGNGGLIGVTIRYARNSDGRSRGDNDHLRQAGALRKADGLGISPDRIKVVQADGDYDAIATGGMAEGARPGLWERVRGGLFGGGTPGQPGSAGAVRPPPVDGPARREMPPEKPAEPPVAGRPESAKVDPAETGPRRALGALLDSLSFGRDIKARWVQRNPGESVDPARVLNDFLKWRLGRGPTAKEVEELKGKFRPRGGGDPETSAMARVIIDGSERTETVFQIYTEEFVSAYAGYIGRLAAEFEARTGRPPRIVEVAAGDGLFARLINERLRGKYTVQATDSKEPDETWRIRFPGDVLQKDAVSAAKDADIIIGVWLPPDTVDYSAPDLLRLPAASGEEPFDLQVARHVAQNPGKVFVVTGPRGVSGTTALWRFVDGMSARVDQEPVDSDLHHSRLDLTGTSPHSETIAITGRQEPQEGSRSTRPGMPVMMPRRPDPARLRHWGSRRPRHPVAPRDRSAHTAAPAEHGPGRARRPGGPPSVSGGGLPPYFGEPSAGIGTHKFSRGRVLFGGDPVADPSAQMISVDGLPARGPAPVIFQCGSDGRWTVARDPSAKNFLVFVHGQELKAGYSMTVLDGDEIGVVKVGALGRQKILLEGAFRGFRMADAGSVPVTATADDGSRLVLRVPGPTENISYGDRRWIVDVTLRENGGADVTLLDPLHGTSQQLYLIPGEAGRFGTRIGDDRIAVVPGRLVFVSLPQDATVPAVGGRDATPPAEPPPPPDPEEIAGIRQEGVTGEIDPSRRRAQSAGPDTAGSVSPPAPRTAKRAVLLSAAASGDERVWTIGRAGRGEEPDFSLPAQHIHRGVHARIIKIRETYILGVPKELEGHPNYITGHYGVWVDLYGDGTWRLLPPGKTMGLLFAQDAARRGPSRFAFGEEPGTDLSSDTVLSVVRSGNAVELRSLGKDLIHIRNPGSVLK